LIVAPALKESNRVSQQLTDFLGQIRSLPDLIETSIWSFEARARPIFNTPAIHGIRQIIIAGSGDSYVAAVAAAPALRAWTGLPVQPMVSMEAARYVDLGVIPRATKGVLVIFLSSSGHGARSIEAAQRLRILGCSTLAVTGNIGSPLAGAVDAVLDVSIPAFPDAPGTRSYVASLMGLLLLGLRIGEVRMCISMDQTNNLRQAIADLGKTLRDSLPRCEEQTRGTVERWASSAALQADRGQTSVDVLGSGPAFGSASYLAAKLIEAPGLHAVAQDAEEFHHLNYFVDLPELIPTILFASTHAAAASRTCELMTTLSVLGRPHLVITDDDTQTHSESRLIMPVVPELLAPLLHVVPSALLAAFWAEQKGTRHFRGHDGVWHGARGGALVRGSKIELKSIQKD
jgi:glucosamine--fructose-6-phosphate aminotransferase (isomerizing)